MPVPAVKGMYGGLAAIILSAAAAVGVVFGLFSSVLAELVPPYEDSNVTVEVVSFVTVIILLVLTLIVRKRLGRVQTWVLAATSALLVAAALAVFFPFREFTRTYVYRFPPASIAHDGQTRHIRGELHERGVERVRDMTVAQAVYELGGPDVVNAMGSLWLEQSRLAVIAKMEREYVALIVLLTTSLFVAGLAVARLRNK
jgi:hypothetical protein